MYEDLTYDELRNRANPKVPQSVIALVKTTGECKRVEPGEKFYSADDREYPFMYVLAGQVEARAPDMDVLAHLEAGNLSGELGLLLGPGELSSHD